MYKNKLIKFIYKGEMRLPRPLLLTMTWRRTERSDCAVPYKNKKACSFEQAFQKKGGDILSHITAGPSAQSGLTSLFGMGRGEPRRNNHLKPLFKV